MAIRIYQATPLTLGELLLDEKASHHLARVLRANMGDEITLFNGEGGEYQALIRAFSKKHVTVELIQFIARDVESPAHLILAQGIARGEKMDFVIQKAVELGVSEIYPVITERCNVRLDKDREEKRLEHWRAVIISACEQSGRNRLPLLHAAISFDTLIETVQADMKFILLPDANQQLKSQHFAANKIALLIGPEGGLGAQEIARAQAADFHALNLGPRVLRTETAALTALAVLQFKFGDL
jgi:16S rRNA (uracil1498-N3)-methyltransferase